MIISDLLARLTQAWKLKKEKIFYTVYIYAVNNCTGFVKWTDFKVIGQSPALSKSYTSLNTFQPKEMFLLWGIFFNIII